MKRADMTPGMWMMRKPEINGYYLIYTKKGKVLLSEYKFGVFFVDDEPFDSNNIVACAYIIPPDMLLSSTDVDIKTLYNVADINGMKYTELSKICFGAISRNYNNSPISKKVRQKIITKLRENGFAVSLVDFVKNANDNTDFFEGLSGLVIK